jgi:AraC-like DNA-binding protein
VIGFITEFRVTMAKEFLKSSETVAEAMYKAGFNDPSYFNRTFKKTCGLSPTAFKNQIIGDQLPSKNLSYSS